MTTAGGQAGQGMTLEERAQAGPGADLVLEGGGVKGIGLVGAVLTLHDAGFVFPRIGGTSAGAIVAALIAAYQVRTVPLTQLQADMAELDYTQFMQKTWAEKHLGLIGNATALVSHQGLYEGPVRQFLRPGVADLEAGAAGHPHLRRPQDHRGRRHRPGPVPALPSGHPHLGPDPRRPGPAALGPALLPAEQQGSG